MPAITDINVVAERQTELNDSTKMAALGDGNSVMFAFEHRNGHGFCVRFQPQIMGWHDS